MKSTSKLTTRELIERNTRRYNKKQAKRKKRRVVPEPIKVVKDEIQTIYSEIDELNRKLARLKPREAKN